MTEVERLQAIFRREGRTFLQYVRESSPWAGHADRRARDEVLALAEEERVALGEFADFLQSKRVPLPYLGAFDIRFTSFNFVAVWALVGPLIRDLRRGVEQLGADLKVIVDPESRSAVDRLADLKQKHLRELEALAESLRPPKSA